MIPEDEAFVARLIHHGIIRGDCLEMGAGLDGHTVRKRVEASGIQWTGTDLKEGPGVVAIDLEKDDAAQTLGRRFQSVLLMNVLEHTYDPIRVLDNAIGATKPGGHCVVLTPTVWPLHYFPLDCWRINPGFYLEYARRHGLTLDLQHFLFVAPRLSLILGNEPDMPQPSTGLRHWTGKAIHKIANTFGRGMHCAPFVSVGAVFRV